MGFVGLRHDRSTVISELLIQEELRTLYVTNFVNYVNFDKQDSDHAEKVHKSMNSTALTTAYYHC